MNLIPEDPILDNINILRQLPPPADGKTGWPWDVQPVSLPERMPDGKAWPRISVTVPSYNQGRFLEETIRSLLLQAYPHLEIFVMDGGSTDNSKAILEKYDSWINAWTSEPDRGQSHAINKGWQQSCGDLITYLNSDDFYLAGTLRQVALAWNYDPDIAVIAGGVAFVNASSELIKIHAPHLNTDSPTDLSLLEISAWYLPQQSSFFSRAHLEQAGRWLREDLHYVMDRELMYRLCRLGRVELIEGVLAADRQHAGAKRQKDRLLLYREDAEAMRYCTWGSASEAVRRQQVARHRLAQGYWMSARDESSRLQKLAYLIRAAFLRPAYLKQIEPFQSLLQALRSLRENFESRRQSS